MRYLIVIPTYNESESISGLLARINLVRNRESAREIEILIVDDNSPDGTAKLVESLSISGVHILNRAIKSGLGPAYLAGFSWGLERGYDFFLEMDADGSHLPEELSAMLLACDQADLVIGSRWVPGGAVVNWPWQRQVISRFGTWYAATLLRLPYRDLTSGFRVISRAALESLPFQQIQSKGYGFQVEIAMRLHDGGFRISEVPITFVEREYGRSKMTGTIVIEACRNVTLWGFKRLLDRR